MNINKQRSAELTPEQQSELDTLKGLYNNKLNELMDENKTLNENIDLSLIWKETEDIAELYPQLSDLKHCLDSFRPFDKNMLKNLMEETNIKYTYESNGIEGNSLTLGETALVIQKGLTIGGKPLVDHLEAINHQEAIHYIYDLVTRDIELSERELKNIHHLILKSIQDEDAGAYRKQPVFIYQQDGAKHDFPQPYLVSKLMEDCFIFYEENKNTMHPVEMAAQLHQKLVNIHPFIDGNGRTSRLIMNLQLIKNGYPIAIIDSEMSKRKDYYKLLGDFQKSPHNASEPFELFVAKKVKEALFGYLQFFSASYSDDSKGKGYEFFKRVESII